MEEERTNNKILDEQSDELRNRRNALDTVRDVDDLAIYPEEASLLLGVEFGREDINTAIAAKFMAGTFFPNWENGYSVHFEPPSEKEALAMWDEAEYRLKNNLPIPIKYDDTGRGECYNIYEICPTVTEHTISEIHRELYDEYARTEANNSFFAVLPEEFCQAGLYDADTRLFDIENITHVFDEEFSEDFDYDVIAVILEDMKDSEILNERAANYIADHIEDCDLSIDEVRNVMAVWMCKSSPHSESVTYPEEMFEPGHLSEKGDESLTAFIEKCDRQKIAEISRMVNRDDILEDENCIEENSPAHEEQKNTTVSQAPERGGLKL